MDLPFLNPLLLAALPAAGIPVLIHLLNRHKSVTIEWGAMELLRRVMVFRSRQIRLEDLVLMAVRCAVILLFLLAVARPTTKSLPVVGRPDAAVAVAVDASLSMQHKPGLTSRFDEAGKTIREVLGTLERGRPLTLVAWAGRPRVLLRNIGYDNARVEDALRGLEASDEPLNLEGCLAGMGQLVGELKAPRREVFLITDAQATTFRRLSEKSALALRTLAESADVSVVAVPCAGEESLAVTEVELSSGVLRAGAIARFQTVVRNLGRSPQDAGEATLLLNDRVVDKRFIGRLGPGLAAPVYLYAPLERAGVVRLTVRAGDDALTADNARHLVIDVRSALRVLVVDGEAADRSEMRAAQLVATALSPTALDRSEARPNVQVIPWTMLGSARLADCQVVALVNVPDVPEDRVEALRKFVEQGGGLVLLPGSNTKPQTMNRRFLTGGNSLLPAEILAQSGEAGDRASARPLDLDLPDHPLARPLRSLPLELLGELRFRRFFEVRPLSEARTVLRLADGQPVILERPLGRGRVLLWTSGADSTWNNLAINPAFPMLLQQAVTYLSRQVFETPVTVGQPIVLPLPMLAAGEPVGVLAPNGAESPVQTLLRAGEVLVETAPTTARGFYELLPPKAEAPLLVAANLDAEESDVKVLDGAELASAFQGLPVRVVDSGRNVAAAVMQARTGHELWQVFMIAGLALLFVEALLARWCTRRGS
jgi:uncharacterized membrane protein